MQFSNKKQVIIIIARQLGIALLIAIFAVAVVIFVGQAIAKIGESLAAKEKSAQALLIRTENIQQMQRSLTLIGDNDQKIKDVYLPADNILEFVNALESVASQNSLRQTMRFSEPSTESARGGIGGLKTNFTISLNGTITTLATYLKQMEELPYMIKINGINFVAASPTGWEGDSTITINGILYVK